MIQFDIIESYILSEIDRIEHENALLRLWIESVSKFPECCVCGKLIPGLNVQRKLRPFVWCSRECFEKKPRKIINLEKVYGMDIKDILKETSRMYGGLWAQVESLGVSVPYFITMVKKYGEEKNYHEFMAKYTTGLRRAGYLKRLNEKPIKRFRKTKSN